MKNNMTWNLMMESHTERRKVVKTPLLVAVVAILHVIAIGSVFFMQGCGTTPTAQVEPPPAPILPPRDLPADRVQIKTPPAFQPSVPVEAAPTVMDDDANVYVVEKGDMLSKIAVRYGVSAREIAELNNLKNPNGIRAGQKLLLPSYAKPVKSSSKPKESKSVPATGTVSGDSYTVASGDSLSKIAARFGVKTKDLQSANSISDPNSIRIGQKLVIPGKTSAASAVEAPVPAPAPASVPEVEDDVSPIEEIPAPIGAVSGVNVMAMPAPVTVTAPAAATSPAAGDSFHHTVTPGESLDSVAILYAVLKKDLAAANGLSESASLTSGQELIIPFNSTAVAP
mgnify:CR=1 FL=1